LSRPAPADAGAVPRPVATAIIAALLACAAAAWLLTAQQASSMSGMGGMAMLGAGLFLVTWVLMMVAMMFPTIAPMVLTHAGIVRSRGEGAWPTVAFVFGYLVIWTAVGLVPLAIIQALGASFAAPIDAWLPRVGGAVVVVAGLYQITSLKNLCLKACRSPLGFVLTHDFGGGTSAAIRAGASHGVYCLGCCWAMMAVLAVVGLMNLAWMAVFAVLFFLEKTWRHGVVLSRISGAVCVVLGLAVIVQPDILHFVVGQANVG
jgi:predicted metal-binding membrane protein